MFTASSGWLETLFKFFVMFAVLRRSVYGNEFVGPISASLRPGNITSFEELLQRWRAVGNSVSCLTGPRFEPQTSRLETNALPLDNFDFLNQSSICTADKQAVQNWLQHSESVAIIFTICILSDVLLPYNLDECLLQIGKSN